jgi:hypothetical protein
VTHAASALPLGGRVTLQAGGLAAAPPELWALIRGGTWTRPEFLAGTRARAAHVDTTDPMQGQRGAVSDVPSTAHKLENMRSGARAH